VSAKMANVSVKTVGRVLHAKKNHAQIYVAGMEFVLQIVPAFANLIIREQVVKHNVVQIIVMA
jgi:hypothetical protein